VVTDYGLYIVISISVILLLLENIAINIDCLNITLLIYVIILIGISNYTNNSNKE
jgi:hypothetical protein